jgi:hypothetical protein
VAPVRVTDARHAIDATYAINATDATDATYAINATRASHAHFFCITLPDYQYPLN